MAVMKDDQPDAQSAPGKDGAHVLFNNGDASQSVISS
jgi:hypothetical protein